MLAWIPFVEPLNALQDIWYLLVIPFSFALAMVYKAYHLHTLDRYWREVVTMTLQIVLALIGLGVALAVLLLVVIPALPVSRG